jgi:hypothetical protein
MGERWPKHGRAHRRKGGEHHKQQVNKVGVAYAECKRLVGHRATTRQDVPKGCAFKCDRLESGPDIPDAEGGRSARPAEWQNRWPCWPGASLVHGLMNSCNETYCCIFLLKQVSFVAPANHGLADCVVEYAGSGRRSAPHTRRPHGSPERFARARHIATSIIVSRSRSRRASPFRRQFERTCHTAGRRSSLGHDCARRVGGDGQQLPRSFWPVWHGQVSHTIGNRL